MFSVRGIQGTGVTSLQTIQDKPEYLVMKVDGDAYHRDNGTRFFDESDNNLAITTFGSGTSQGTFSPFNENWSCFFDGAGDYLTTPSSAVFAYGTSDFTIECWIYPNTIAAGVYIFDSRPVGTQGAYPGIVLQANGNVDYTTTSATRISSTNNPVIFNKWNHICVSRYQGQTKLFVNGKQVGSTYADSNSYLTTRISIGTDGRTPGDNPFFGYMSNFRVVNGTALYTANFTPPTTKLTAVTNTSLLCMQDAYLKDNSTNSFTISRTGDVRTAGFNPFGIRSANYSAYFDGNGDALTIPDNNAFNFGSSNFTVEFWFNTSNVSSGWLVGQFESSAGADTNSSFTFLFNASKLRAIVAYNNSTSQINLDSTTTIEVGKWYHVAYVRNGSTLTMYINGIAEATSSTIGASVVNNSNLNINIGQRHGGTLFYTGYISNLRITKGTAVYTSDFILSSSRLELLPDTTLLVLQDSTIKDNSQNKFEVTVVGNTVVSTDNPFGTPNAKNTVVSNSVYFDGSGDFLTLGGQTALALAATDFTVEFWVNFSGGLGNNQVIYDTRPASTNGAYLSIYKAPTTDTFAVYVNSATTITGTTAVVTGTWYHVAVTRSGTSTRLFVNGIQEGSTWTDSTNYLNGASRPIIGADGTNTATNNLNGYVSNLRVIKGIAVYTSNFTAPTAPLSIGPVPSATSLLTCQGSAIVDGSRNNFTVTANGNARVYRISPFSTRSTDITVGSAGFASTSTNYLAIADNVNLRMGTGDFTIEAWVYLSDYSVANVIFTKGSASAGDIYFYTLASTGALTFAHGATPTTISGSVVPLKIWTHVAVVRSGGTVTMYINGQATGTPTAVATDFNSTGEARIARGITTSTNYFNGFISNFRIVKGTAVYTTNFTTPTTPVGKIAGTSLLLNFAAPGIADVTQNSVFRTVADATASYSSLSGVYPKSGSTGIYMDGTGDYLTTMSDDLGFGTGDFTIEMWYFPSAGNNHVLYDMRPTSINGTSYLALFRSASFFPGMTVNGVDVIVGNMVMANQNWYHVALSRVSGTTRLFVNGNLQGTYADTNNYLQASFRPQIGFGAFSTGAVAGMLDDIKVHRGFGKYTKNFYAEEPLKPTREYAKKIVATTTGGTVTTVGDYKVHTFTSDGTITFAAPAEFEYLVVGGGGGGASGGGNAGRGGGGAGGFLTGTATTSAAETLTVAVGGGGSGGYPGANGKNSSIIGESLKLIALGGGGGGSSNTNALSGASGGGSAGSGTVGAGAEGPPRQGYSGGNGSGTFSVTVCGGGGGGGAGGPGGASPDRLVRGASGPGRLSSISGTPVVYATGGEGGTSTSGAGISGSANTGNGGQAGGGGSTPTGGNGGSGIVIIRYRYQ